VEGQEVSSDAPYCHVHFSINVCDCLSFVCSFLALSLSHVFSNLIIFVTLLFADIQGRQDVAAMVTLTGVVHARAYASAREPLQRAITDLKARFNTLCLYLYHKRI
jgi:hypothetical protein